MEDLRRITAVGPRASDPPRSLHQRAAEDRTGPEAGRRPLAKRQRSSERSGERQHPADDRGMHRIDIAQCEAQKKRKADHGARGTDDDVEPLMTLRAGCARDEQVADAEQPRERRAARGDEQRRQLRVGRRPDGQARHRQRHREDHHAEQTKPESARLVARWVHAWVSGHWRTFVLRTPVFALGAARRADGCSLRVGPAQTQYTSSSNRSFCIGQVAST